MQEAFRRLPIFFSLLGARYSQSVLNQRKKKIIKEKETTAQQQKRTDGGAAHVD